MIRTLIGFLMCVALAGCHSGHSAPKVSRPWVRLAAVPGRPAAGYFILEGGSRAAKLIRVESALAGRVEMHESMGGAGGMAAMRPLETVDVPARTAVTFAPGGRHIMVFDLDAKITAGTAVPLRFGFADGSTVEAEAKTVSAGEDAPY